MRKKIKKAIEDSLTKDNSLIFNTITRILLENNLLSIRKERGGQK